MENMIFDCTNEFHGCTQQSKHERGWEAFAIYLRVISSSPSIPVLQENIGYMIYAPNLSVDIFSSVAPRHIGKKKIVTVLLLYMRLAAICVIWCPPVCHHHLQRPDHTGLHMSGAFYFVFSFFGFRQSS